MWRVEKESYGLQRLGRFVILREMREVLRRFPRMIPARKSLQRGDGDVE